jgi:hypothetical protein
VESGTTALEAQLNSLGLGRHGKYGQQRYIEEMRESPQYQSIVKSGENALLQNASATGGLRGGNLQGALAQFRPQILSQLIESQYNKLGGISSLGQASAAGQAAAGQQYSNSISNLLGQYGQAKAGGALGKAQAISGAVDTGIGMATAAFGGGF